MREKNGPHLSDEVRSESEAKPDVRPETKPDALVDAALAALRGKCASPPAAPGFLAGFRARRDAWLERGEQAAAWRSLALRLSPVGALAAGVAAVVTLGAGLMAPGTPSETPLEVLPDVLPENAVAAEYPDPFVAGLTEAGVATVAMNGDEGAYELLAVLYEPVGTR